MPSEKTLNKLEFPIGNMFWDIILNAVIPLLIYQFCKNYFAMSELTSLLWSTSFPILKSIFDLKKRQQLDPISVVVFLSIIVSTGAVFLGGNPKLLIIRESFFTGLLGIICFISLLLPRPLMFYFGRYFIAGNDIAKRKEFEDKWEIPDFRFSNRLITIVWGFAFTGELALKTILVYVLPISWSLAVTPFTTGGITILTILWTFGYIRKRRQAAN